MKYLEAIEKMNKEQFSNFIWAMFQDNDYCVFEDDELVESEMWNIAQGIENEYDLEDEEDFKKAKEIVKYFFNGEVTMADEETFDKVTGEFLASYFGKKQTAEEVFDSCVTEYMCFDDSAEVNAELYAETKKFIGLIDNGTISGYTILEIGVCGVAGENVFRIKVKPSHINKGKPFHVFIQEKTKTLRIGSTERDITDYSSIKSQFTMAAMNEFCGFSK